MSDNQKYRGTRDVRGHASRKTSHRRDPGSAPYGLEEGREVLVEETPEGLLLRPAVTLPIEMYSKERRAVFLLQNAVEPRRL